MKKQMNVTDYVESKIPNLRSDLKFNELERYIIQKTEVYDAFYDVSIGCSNSEHQANEYFRDDVYENLASVFEIDLDLYVVELADEVFLFENDTDYMKFKNTDVDHKLYHLSTIYYVNTENQDYVEAEYVFESKNEAIKFVDELGEEFQSYPTIEAEMAYFKSALAPSLQNRTEIEVKKEYNNGGHFHSYNIYLDNNLIEDGVFKLEAVSFSNEVEMLDELIQHLDSNYGINLTNIQKEKHNFERYYNFDLNKTYESDMGVFTFTQNHSIHIKGGQGQPRTTIDTILNNLDIDYIMLEFDDAFKEEMNDQISMYEFCNVTEDDIAQINQKER